MINRILITSIAAVLGLLFSLSLKAQDKLPANWNTEKIRGTRLIPYPSVNGSPYLTGKFLPGEIEFMDGEKIGEINLRYSSYRDEIIYYNTTISTQIVIDKMSLKGFSFKDEDGTLRIFRKQYYNGFMSGNRYFEVLSDGDIALLVYRKVGLETCSPYNDESGKLKNLEYQPNYSYYLYSSDKGYSFVRISKSGLLSKFDKADQILVKKIFRKNHLSVADEVSFIKAWNLIRESRIKVNF